MRNKMRNQKIKRNKKINLCLLATIYVAMASALTAVTVSHGKDLEKKIEEKLIIVLPQAQINFIESSASAQLKIKFDESEMVLTKKGIDQELRLRDPSGKDNSFKANEARRLVEVLGPSIPVEVHLGEGLVHLTQWNKDVLLDIQKGKIFAKNCKTSLAVQLRRGEVLVSDHQGRLVVDSYAGNVLIRNLNGNLDLDNFSGESNLEKSKGRFDIHQTTGAVKVTQSTGNLLFDIGRATMTSNLFSGRVEGQSQEGAVSISMTSDSEVNVKAQMGRVTIQTVPGVALNLHTQDGEIFGPKYLSLQREGNAKSLKGRLQGQMSKGNVYVRTQDGAIIIK